MSLSTTKNRPTDRQLRFLKSLAEQTGTSFTYPKTRWQASREVERLVELKDSGCTPPSEMEETDERSLVYATAVADHEVSGYGSTATWSQAPVDDPLCVCGHRLSRHSSQGDTRCLDVEHRTELIGAFDEGRDGPIAYCECLRFDDGSEPRRTGGYSALKALVADYIEQAHRLDAIPMASSVVRRELEQLGTGA